MNSAAVRLCLLPLLISLITVLWPAVDLAMASIFYDPETGFIGGLHPWRLIRRSGEAVTVGLACGCGALLFYKRLRIKAATALLLLALGPGLLVNGVFKSYWGRPRPVQITDFGGQMPFMRAWSISDHCPENCSFMSGEAAASFWIITPAALLLPVQYRVLGVALAIGWGTLIGLTRMAAGGHFLSDVAAAALLVFLLHSLALNFLRRKKITA